MSTSLAIPDLGLSTIIGRMDRDASGKMINEAMRSTMDRLRIWDYRTQSQSYTDRNLINACLQLTILKNILWLSDSVIEKAAYIYRKAIWISIFIFCIAVFCIYSILLLRQKWIKVFMPNLICEITITHRSIF
jgi:hypothetical protein